MYELRAASLGPWVRVLNRRSGTFVAQAEELLDGFFSGTGIPQRGGDGWSVPIVIELRDKPVGGFGQTCGGERGDDGVAKRRFAGRVVGALQVGNDSGRAVLGKDEGSFGGEVVLVRQKGRDPVECGVSIEMEHAGETRGEDFRFVAA